MKSPLSFLDDTSIDTLKGPSLFSHILFFTVVLFAIIAIIWADNAILDEVTTGEGKVIPSQDIQVIQNLEGGIVGKIFVQQGQIVQKGQPLIQIDDKRFSAEYKEVQKKITHLKIRINRLESESNLTDFVIPKTIKEANSSFIESQISLYNAKIAEKKQLLQFCLCLIELF
jgi:adhesin transport system membrane fusion protein